MEEMVEAAQNAGLINVSWAGRTGIPGKIFKFKSEDSNLRKYNLENAKLTVSYALTHGCRTVPRNCKKCVYNQTCEIKKYSPKRII